MRVGNLLSLAADNQLLPIPKTSRSAFPVGWQCPPIPKNNKSMIAAETHPMTALEPKHPRLVSFENSNSWIKRHCSNGTLVIQAGYRTNPNKMARRDNENPIVLIEGQPPRWYGSRACEGQHTAIHGRSKIDTARDSFAACLQPSDHGQTLTVAASHWGIDEFPALQRALLGQYKIIRNGELIQCAVSTVIPVLEGSGSFYDVQAKLKPGKSLLIELGYGTAEVWTVAPDGAVDDGRVVDALGIFNLVNSIAADSTVRSLVQDDAGTVNTSFISSSLQRPTLGKIGEANWQAIKAKYASEYLRTLQAFIKTQFGDQSQTLSNIILTGGGAALLRDIQPKVDSVFAIPAAPQVASVVGTWAHQLSLG
jgi:hypothetical protein